MNASPLPPKNSVQKRPFALAEVCVALIVLGIILSYSFSSLHQSITRYTQLRQEITCHEMADEYLGCTIASLLMKPLDFDSIASGFTEKELYNYYQVLISGEVRAKEEKSSATSTTESKKKTSLLDITVTVTPHNVTGISASRTTSLCITKEGL